MLQSFKAIRGQSIVDLALNTYGTVNLLGKLIKDNAIADLNATTNTGDLLNWDDSLVADQNLYAYIVQNNTKFLTGVGKQKYILAEDGFILQTESGQNLEP